MPSTSRRDFCVTTGAALAATVTRAEAEQGTAAEKSIVLGLIGCGGRGTKVAEEFSQRTDVRLAYVCDPDESRRAKAANHLQGHAGRAPLQMADLRRVLDDAAVDAVIVATPDHWHAPATILACEAGKHVYVEKPCSHNIREGRLMVQAARRHQRVVQIGTQSRSGPHVQRAMELLRQGAIGDVLVAKVWNSQKRREIGHGRPGHPPQGLDYDLWLGPAPYVPFQANRLHYGWHWWYGFGTGDIGNDGVHDIDIGRWGLGVEVHPTTVAAIGGKYFFDDDQQFPDTQYVVCEYPGDGQVGSRRQLVFEQRIWSPYRQQGYENGNAFYGTKGMLLLGKNDGWKLFGPRNELRQTMDYQPRTVHHVADFIHCIRTQSRPRADIAVGHLSTSICHLGNIAARVGRTLTFNGRREEIVGDDQANALIRREYRPDHWAVPRGV